MASESALFTSFHIGLPPWRCQRTLPLREVPTRDVQKVMKMKQDCLRFCIPWRQATHGVSLGPSCNLRKKLRRSTIKASMWAASKSIRKFSLEGPSGAFWIHRVPKQKRQKETNEQNNQHIHTESTLVQPCMFVSAYVQCTLYKVSTCLYRAFWSYGWVDGWMDGWVDGWVAGWTDKWTINWNVEANGRAITQQAGAREKFRSNMFETRCFLSFDCRSTA